MKKGETPRRSLFERVRGAFLSASLVRLELVGIHIMLDPDRNLNLAYESAKVFFSSLLESYWCEAFFLRPLVSINFPGTL